VRACNLGHFGEPETPNPPRLSLGTFSRREEEEPTTSRARKQGPPTRSEVSHAAMTARVADITARAARPPTHLPARDLAARCPAGTAPLLLSTPPARRDRLRPPPPAARFRCRAFRATACGDRMQRPRQWLASRAHSRGAAKDCGIASASALQPTRTRGSAREGQPRESPICHDARVLVACTRARYSTRSRNSLLLRRPAKNRPNLAPSSFRSTSCGLKLMRLKQGVNASRAVLVDAPCGATGNICRHALE